MGWLEYLKHLLGNMTTAEAAGLTAVLLLALCLLMRRGGGGLRKLPAKDSMPGYVLVYADQKGGGIGQEDFGKLLYSARYGLQGKPDYVFRSRLGGKIVPMELKSGKIGDAPEPHRGDFLQLAAYFLLLEDVYGRKPKFGRLVYADYMFEIRNTAAVRREALRTMEEMRRMLETGEGRAECSFAHCRHCICNGTVCEFTEKA